MLGDLGYTSEYYAEARERLQNDRRPLIGAARVALTRNRDEPANKLIAEVLSVSPSSADAWTLKGMNHHDRGEYEPACEALNKALALEPESTRALSTCCATAGLR